jgi:DNA polymerase V
MAYLDQEKYKQTLWDHTPLTDFWHVGRGTQNRLAKYNIHTMKQISECDPKILYKEFGINAEYLIDHSKGIEPCTIKEVHNYVRKNNSMSNNQILFEDYKYEDAFLVLKEMVELNVLELVDKHLVTNSIYLHIGYSKDVIKPVGASMKLDEYTSSYAKLNEYFINLFRKNVDKNHMIRRIGIGFGNVIDESYATYNLFTDITIIIKKTMNFLRRLCCIIYAVTSLKVT